MGLLDELLEAGYTLEEVVEAAKRDIPGLESVPDAELRTSMIRLVDREFVDAWADDESSIHFTPTEKGKGGPITE